MRTGRQLVACFTLMFVFSVLAASAKASSMEWVQIGQPLTPRSESGMCYDSFSNSVFLFGGKSTEKKLMDTWEWSGEMWQFKSSEHIPDEMWDTPPLIYDLNGNRIFLLGCRVSDDMFQIWEWTGIDWALIDENDTMSPGWSSFGCSYDVSRDVICLFGGYSDISIDVLWEWDHNEWHQIPKAGNWPPACTNPGMTYNPDIQKNVIVVNQNEQMEVWYWDGSIWEQQVSSSNQPPERYHTDIAYDPDRMRLVMFGGYGNLNDTWEWDGIRWYEMNPPNKPSGRHNYAFTWDGQSHRIMLVGGINTGLDRNGETWFYDGTDWTCVQPDPYYPLDVLEHAMAFDLNQQIAVLYGGMTYSQMPTETFEWNGSEWTGIPDPINPGSMIEHGMSFMGSLDGIILYGGSSLYGDQIYDNTWLYRNHSWIQLTPQFTAGPRFGFSIAYDSIRDRLILFGGTVGYEDEPPYWYPVYSDETWEFDGNSWYQVFPPHHPPALGGAEMIFDSCRGVTVLFGGGSDSGFNNKTWEYNGVDWTRIEPATASPDSRHSFGFTFDTHRCRVVMHGGIRNLEPGFNETWEWDGYDWYLIEPNSGRAPSYHHTAMVYDSVRKGSMMYGGGREGYTVETLVYRHSNPDICEQMGVTLELSQTLFHTGDTFSCIAHVCNNTGDVLTGYPLLVLLDVYGSLFWAPSFTQEFDCFLDDYPSFPEGTTDVEVLPSFAWPPNAGSAQGIRFYAALTDPAIHILIGHWDMAEFGWE